VTKYDFLAGEAVYKDRLSTDYQPFRNIQVWNRTWRVRARTVYGAVKRRALRVLPGRSEPDASIEERA
jgi:hypothetical protein